MSKPMIYLAGKMSGLTFDQMSKWRKDADFQLKDYFKVINPVDFYNFEMDRDSYTDHEVKFFDLMAVKKSQLILVNLRYPNSIGTAIELHMAHDEWKIPVIAYEGKDQDDVHPWISTSLTKWCNTLDEAIDHIVEFYVPILA